MVKVTEDVRVFGRFYPIRHEAPSILYFHGNGEVACDYDSLAPIYHEIDANLFVADYRGYGPSEGRPGFASMAADAAPVFEYFQALLIEQGYNSGDLFIMGRSLGSQSALEIAASYYREMAGLILESGFVQSRRLLGHLGLPVAVSGIDDFERASLQQISEITVPALIIHGESDMLIPWAESDLIYRRIGSVNKDFLLIKGGGHNDLMLVGMQDYFRTIQGFIHSGGEDHDED